MLDQEVRRFSASDAAELYDIARWGKGYFSIDDSSGHVRVHPTKEPERWLDLKQLVDRLQLRGIDLPILIRFAEILKHRLGEIHKAFAAAITEHRYTGNYCCVYPIKVNQQRQVVEEVLRFGKPYQFGLEAGSKPELMAVVAMAANDTPIICNGFKDAEFIEMAMMALKMGRQIIPVVEKYTELELIFKMAEKIGVRPVIGVRVKLAARGSGRWQQSGGFRSKFGLTVTEILRALGELKSRGMEDCFKLLHFHLGSQITNIRQIKGALNEAVRVYVDLVKQGAGLTFLDVGGGLGVDYDGSQTNFESSANYTLQEYANDVVYHVQSVCDEASVAHPTIISESGRAVVAYHSALVFSVLGVAGQGENDVPLQLPEDVEQPLYDLLDTYQNLTVRNVLEGYHDASQSLDMAMNLFAGGYLPLVQRSMAENLFWAICHKIQRLSRQLEFVPEELEGLDAMLSDTYFCNFSLFQSMPDSWAIKQLFPVMPIHRLNERPTRHAVLGDITCDSDGKIEQFIDRRDVKRTLPLHSFNGEPYYLGAFLLGAYQEMLGDMHNLFGDTNAVHVSMDDDGEVVLETVIKGDTVREVLDYVEFNVESLMRQFRTSVELAVRESRIGYEEAGRFLRYYEDGLQGYTYLEEPHEKQSPVQGSAMVIRGAIFDLDGTLVDSGLDFDQMRREMGLAPGLPLLEAIERLPDVEAARCWTILEQHELGGARRATLYPGVREFLYALGGRGIRRAVFTRNSRTHTRSTLDRLQVAFDPVVCREDGPVKPHPRAIWKICEAWGLDTRQCVVIGDHRFDIAAGRAAGCATVLFTGSGQASGLHAGESADHTLTSFAEPAALWDWIDQIDLGGSGGSC